MTKTTLAPNAPWPAYIPEDRVPKYRSPKVTPKEAENIRLLFASGANRRFLALKYNVHMDTIDKIRYFRKPYESVAK
jgi:hypothetical protein